MPQGLGHSLGKAFLPGQAVTSSTASGPAPDPLPPGGTTGQVLAKTSNADGAVGWVTPAAAVPNERLVPPFGAIGQVLAKTSGLDYTVGWVENRLVPPGGADGNQLTKDGAAPFQTRWDVAIVASVNLEEEVVTLRSKLAAIVNRMDTLQKALQDANARVDRVVSALQPSTRTPSKKKE